MQAGHQAVDENRPLVSAQQQIPGGREAGGSCSDNGHAPGRNRIGFFPVPDKRIAPAVRSDSFHVTDLNRVIVIQSGAVKHALMVTNCTRDMW